MPSAEFSTDVVLAHSPGEVWDAMQRAEVWVGIGPIERVSDAVHDDGGRLRQYRWEASVAGRNWSGTARTIESSPGEVMALAMDSPEMQAVLTARLAADGEGTAMHVHLDLTLQGMMAGLFWGVITQAIHSTLPRQAAEFGERVTPA